MRRTTTGARPAGRSELKAWYKTALAEQASSGMSVTAFASRIGVAVSTLYQWRRRLDDSRIRVGRSGPQLLEVALAKPSTTMPSSCCGPDSSPRSRCPRPRKPRRGDSASDALFGTGAGNGSGRCMASAPTASILAFAAVRSAVMNHLGSARPDKSRKRPVAEGSFAGYDTHSMTSLPLSLSLSLA